MPQYVITLATKNEREYEGIFTDLEAAQVKGSDLARGLTEESGQAWWVASIERSEING